MQPSEVASLDFERATVMNTKAVKDSNEETASKYEYFHKLAKLIASSNGV